MSAMGTTGRKRVLSALAQMYRGLDHRTVVLLDSLGAECHCSRRALERAFERLGTSPLEELRAIRADVAGAHLVHDRASNYRLSVIAMRVGYADPRALRREIRERWGMRPRDIRRAARLGRTIASWNDIRAARIARTTDRSRLPSVYHRAWRQAKANRTEYARLLDGAPPRTRELIRGELDLPTAPQAAERADQLAREHLDRLLARRPRAELRAAA